FAADFLEELDDAAARARGRRWQFLAGCARRIRHLLRLGHSHLSSRRLAGVEGLEPPAYGFGGRRSTNLATLLHSSWPSRVSTRGPPIPSLLNNTCDDAGTDGSAAFADGEAQLLLHRDRHDQLDLDGDVVARHHHLGAFGKLHDPGHVRRPEIELRAVVGEE